MYKRAARVLFVGTFGDWRIDLAVRLVGEIAAGWMEARGAEVQGLDADTLAWADLVVPLDQHTRQRCPPLPPTARLKAWDMSGLSPDGTETEIRRRLLAVLGGLRLLARMDQVEGN